MTSKKENIRGIIMNSSPVEIWDTCLFDAKRITYITSRGMSDLVLHVVLSRVHQIHMSSYMVLQDTRQTFMSALAQERGCPTFSSQALSRQVISNLLLFEYIVISLSLDKYSIIYTTTKILFYIAQTTSIV